MFHYKNIAGFLVLLLLSGGSLFAFSVEPLFDGGISYRAGMEPGQIISCDLDNNSYPDIVVVNSGLDDSTISVFINKGDGSFEDAVNYNVGGRVRAVTAGDFYGDTLLDLAVLLYTEDSVIILINDGDSLRLDTLKFAVESDPRMLVAADLNGDGDTLLDLATVSYDSGTVSVLLNIYDSTFAEAVHYPADDNPIDLCAFRLDTNLSPDIAVANEGADDVSLLLNDGTGVFTLDTTINMGTGNTPRAISTGDFDNDNDDDLAVAFADRVMILYNHYNDSGVVIPRIQDDTLAGVRDIATADVDNDNDVDIITVGDDGAVTVLYNLIDAADTSFGNATTYGNNFPGNNVYSVCAADFNADNNIDLATGNFLTDNISILFNYGGGVFPAPKSYKTDYCAFAVAGGELDAANGADLIVSNWSGKDISLFTNNGDSTFEHIIDLPLKDNLGYICLGDFDLINGLDLAVTNYNNDSVTVSLHTNNSTPANLFGPYANYYAGPGPYEIQTADVNADTALDLVVGDYDSTTVAVIIGNRDGTFADAVFYEAGSWPGHVKCYDFDSDDDIDIITTNYYSDSVGILLNDGNGVFAPPLMFYAGDGPSTAFPADLDNDGDCDLVVTDYDSDSISILTNNGFGSLSISSQFSAGMTPTYVNAIDFDLDGDSDLVVSNLNSHDISVFENNAGTFTFNANYNVGRGPRMVLPLDIDGDIDQDLVVCSCIDGMITVILNRTTLPPLPTDVGENPDRAAIPDNFILQANYPNPFNPSTTIKYALPERSDVTISIYNILGQKITTIVNETKPAGEYTTIWDGRDANGRPVASGLYLYQIKAGKFTESRKMLLLK